MRGYLKHPLGFYYSSKEGLRKIENKLNEVPACIFDLDGTLYPGLLLADLCLDFIKNYKSLDDGIRKKKLRELKRLKALFGSADFLDVSTGFAKMLEGFSYLDFHRTLPLHMDRLFKGAMSFLRRMKAFGKKCYLVSLTSKKIAKEISMKVGFDEFWSMEFKKDFNGREEVFAGDYIVNVREPARFKEKCLPYFHVSNGSFLMAGNSMDDVILLNKARLKIGVRPDRQLLEAVNFDILLLESPDPWKGLAKWAKAI